MIVAIHAYEDTYYGLHGIEDHWVREVEDLEHAKAVANDMCDDVIDEYIEEKFYDMAEGVYEIYELNIKNPPIGKSFSSLTSDFSADKDNFLKKYGAKRLI